MSTFRYDAISKDGVQVRGVVKARDRDEAVGQLKQEHSIVINLKETYDYEGLKDKLNSISTKISLRSLSVVCEQFSIMLDAGIGIETATRLAAKQSSDRIFRRILTNVADDVAAGYRVADSFAIHGTKLPATFIETIRSGEESGSLSEAFKRLSEFYMARHKLYAKIKGALGYPVFIIVLAAIVISIVMTKAVPTIARTFVDQGNELPAITLFLINVSEFFGKWIWLIVLIILIIVVAFIMYSRTPEGGMKLSKLMLRLPLIGRIERLSIASQFSSTMATMLVAGLPIVRALSITGRTITNKYIEESIRRTVSGVESGYSLGECLCREDTLDELLIEMCAMGENAGSMEETLTAISKYYDYETETAANNALKVLEPTILIFLGIFVGFIVIALYLPMFTMYNGM